MKKKLALAVVAALLMLAVVTASAEASVNCGISTGSSGGGQVSFTAWVSTSTAVDQIGFVQISIYDETGDLVKTEYGRYSYNTDYYSYTATYSGTSGMRYYATATYYAQDGSAIDQGSISSGYVRA